MGSYEFDICESGCIITRYYGDDITVNIPEKIDGHYVKGIGSGITPTFENTKVEVITLPPSVETINNYAFYLCGELKEIKLSPCLKSIGINAFYSCASLSNIELNSGLESIRRAAFAKCLSLQSITIPSSVKEIENSAFLLCNSLKELIISEGVKFIGHNAFALCSQLQVVELPSTLQFTSESAFDGCTVLSLVGFYAKKYLEFRDFKKAQKKKWEINRKYEIRNSLDLSDLINEMLKNEAEITELAITYSQNDRYRNTPIDLTPLSKLTCLKKLSITDASLNSAYWENDKSELPMHIELLDVSALSSLTDLIYLDLSVTPVQDLKPISQLINLQKLDLRFTQIYDVSDIANLINLVELDLLSCFLLKEIDINILRGFIKLEKISVPTELQQNNRDQIDEELIALEFVYGDYKNIYIKHPKTQLKTYCT